MPSSLAGAISWYVELPTPASAKKIHIFRMTLASKIRDRVEAFLTKAEGEQKIEPPKGWT
jgi:hypothetical protein